MQIWLVLLLSLLLLAAGCQKGNDNGTGPDNGNGESLSGASISLDHVEGLVAGKIPVGGQVTFYLRFTNNSGDAIKGFTDGIRVYSPDGATWTTTSADTTGTLSTDAFSLFVVNPFSADGRGADTIGLAGVDLTSNLPGMTHGFDDITYYVTVGPAQSQPAGKTICLDSSFFRPTGSWLWAPAGGTGAGKPAWDGPHCYKVGQ